MITNEDGGKCSAKELAQEILVRCMERMEFWGEENADRLKLLTEREGMLLNDQLEKLFVRAMRVMGIKPGEIILHNDPEHPAYKSETYEKADWNKEPPPREVGAPGVPVVAPPGYVEYELPAKE